MFSKKNPKVHNARRFRRLYADYLIKYQLAGSTSEPVVSNIKDLSAGGVKFWTDQFLAEGALLKVEFLVPPLGFDVQALARVARVRQAKKNSVFYVALRFIEIPEGVKKGIDNFIEHLATLPGTERLVDHTSFIQRQIMV